MSVVVPRVFLVSILVVAFAVVQPALAVPPAEVQNLSFSPDEESISWGAVAGADAFHLYRGDVAGLPDNWQCLAGSLITTASSDSATPAPGQAFSYLASAFNMDGEGTLGTRSDSTPRVALTPCDPARRVFDLTPNGDVGDGVIDGVIPRQNPSLESWSSRLGMTAVVRHTGELFHRSSDLQIPGRGLNWSMRRCYHNQIAYDGPLGRNWDFEYNARLRPSGVDVLYFDGTGRRELFAFNGGGYDSPQGLYAVLHQNADDSWTLRHPNGRLHNFNAFDAPSAPGALDSIEDRAGNRMVFLYDPSGRLVTAVDSMGRSISYGYDTSNRIDEVTDYSGRVVTYTYDGAGNLTDVTRPAVIGTPTGNDFPTGKTMRYGYDASSNLTSLTAPNEVAAAGPPRLVMTYGVAGFELDRVITQQIGGTNATGTPAGGTKTFTYTQLGPSTTSMPDQPSRSVFIEDRVGNLSDHAHNALGNELTRIDLTNRNVRPGEPDYTTERRFNLDGELLQLDRPLLNTILYTYDAPGADRYREGNLLEKQRVADTVLSGGRGDGRGAEIDDIIETYEYDPMYNRLVRHSGPRENDPAYTWPVGNPVNSAGRESTTRLYDWQEGDPATNGVNDYATRFGIDLTGASTNLGDVNGDSTTDAALGTLIRLTRPTASLFGSSAQATVEGDTDQESEETYAYNALGQLIRHTDAERNVHLYEYYAETDPDGDGNPSAPPADGRTLDVGTGGYRSSQTRDTASDPLRNNATDPAPTLILTTYEYDDVGNRVGVVDGRGILTRYVINELNQIVEIRRAAATESTGGPFGDPATGRGESGLSPFGYRDRFVYDENDNIVRTEREDDTNNRGLGLFIPTTREYDILDNMIVEQESANAPQDIETRFDYDANENLVRVTEPESNSGLTVYDERDLVFTETLGDAGPFGGAPSTTTYTYDGNGNATLVVDGRGAETDVIYDGFDRAVSSIDRVGNRSEQFYDPAHRIRVEHFGPIGGPTPTDRLGTGNVALAATEFVYDERGRLVQQNDELFVSPGVSTVRPIDIQEGGLVPGDGFINTVYEYDRLDRRSFTTQDSGSETRLDYDGAGRLILLTQPDQSTATYFYDANANLVEREDVEQPEPPGPPPALFYTTRLYDSLDRLVQEVDPVGQTDRFEYDSLDAVTVRTDGRGPAGGSINRISTGAAQPINDHGNVTRTFYDGLDRVVRTERLLTPSGEGDGSTSPGLDLTNPSNPDGIIERLVIYDDNSRKTDLIDDLGNTTTYVYDNLNRVTRTTHADGTLFDYEYDQNHNLEQYSDPNGSTITYTNDPADRRVQTDITRGAGVEGTTLQVFEYDGLHRMTLDFNNNDPGGGGDDAERITVYDSLSRVVETQLNLAGLSSKAFDVAYAAHALPTRLTYPSGVQISLGHGPADRLIGMNDLGRPEGLDYQYFGMHRVAGMGFGNGVQLNIGWDDNRRQVLREYLDALFAPIAVWESAYDRNDLLVGQLDMHNPLGPDIKGDLMSYDSANRLRDLMEAPLDPGFNPQGPPIDETNLLLDGEGNIADAQRNGNGYAFQQVNSSLEYDETVPPGDDGVPDDVWDPTGTPAADGLNHQRDDNGNLRDAGQFTYNMNAFNQVTSVVRNSDGLTVSILSYWADGSLARREAQNVGAQNEQRAYYPKPEVPLSPVSDSGTGGSVAEQYNFLDQRILTLIWGQDDLPMWQIDQSSNSQYFGIDTRGNVSFVTDGNTSNLLERMVYSPGGTIYFQDAGNNFKVDGGGNFLPKSDFDVDLGYLGWLYLDEVGQRSNQRENDFVVGTYITDDWDKWLYDPSIFRLTTEGPKGDDKLDDPYAIRFEIKCDGEFKGAVNDCPIVAGTDTPSAPDVEVVFTTESSDYCPQIIYTTDLDAYLKIYEDPIIDFIIELPVEDDTPPELPPQLEQLRLELGDEQFAEWLHSNREQFGNLQGYSEGTVEDPQVQDQIDAVENVLDQWLKDFHKADSPEAETEPLLVFPELDMKDFYIDPHYIDPSLSAPFQFYIPVPDIRFDPPADIHFPGADRKPAQQLPLFDFDHDIGEFEAIGAGTVTEDGTCIPSDPGLGVVKGG